MDVVGVSGVWKCGSVVYIWLVKRTYTGTEADAMCGRSGMDGKPTI